MQKDTQNEDHNRNHQRYRHHHHHGWRHFLTVDETSVPVTRNPFLNLKHCHVIQPSGSRTSLRDKSFCLEHILWSFATTRSAWVPLKSVAIPETVLTSLLLRHQQQLSSGLHTLSSQSYSPAHACALFCICRTNFDHVEHVTQV